MRITKYINKKGTYFLRPDRGVPLTIQDILMERVNREDEAIIYEVPLPKFKGEEKSPVSAVIGNWAIANIKSFFKP